MNENEKRRIINALKSTLEGVRLDIVDFSSFNSWREGRRLIIEQSRWYTVKHEVIDYIEQAIRILELEDMTGLEIELMKLIEKIKYTLNEADERGKIYAKKISNAIEDALGLKPEQRYYYSRVTRLEQELDYLRKRIKHLENENYRLKNRNLLQRLFNK